MPNRARLPQRPRLTHPLWGRMEQTLHVSPCRYFSLSGSNPDTTSRPVLAMFGFTSGRPQSVRLTIHGDNSGGLNTSTGTSRHTFKHSSLLFSVFGDSLMEIGGLKVGVHAFPHSDFPPPTLTNAASPCACFVMSLSCDGRYCIGA